MDDEPDPRAARRIVTRRRLVFVDETASAPPPVNGTAVVVLDPTWTPAPGDRPDLLSARQVQGRVIERIDLFDGALGQLDAWAAASGIADTLAVEGTTYWFRLRETMWRWVHEHLLWRHTIGELERAGSVDEVVVLAIDPALADVVRARWPDARIEDPSSDAASAAPPTADRGTGTSPLGRVGRLLGRGRPSAPPSAAAPASRLSGMASAEERDRREAILAERAARLAADGRPRVIVLTNPGTHQRIGAGGGTRRDPLFGSVIPDLEARGHRVVLLATGIDQRHDEDWALVADDDRMLPQFLLRTRWAQPEDDERTAHALAAVEAAIDGTASSRLELDGLDLTDAFLGGLRSSAVQVIRTDVQMLARIERLIGELRPVAILLAQEGIRTPWLVAGHAADVPVIAVQHGILYAGHAGYPNVRHPALRLPTRTSVYGAFEREVLLDLAYRNDEVVVTGSPRLDLDTAMSVMDRDAERAEVRRELGVADGDRLLVVSTVNLRFVQRSHFAHMLEVLLSPPPPGVHVVFKLHPGERDEGPYRALLEGLARAASVAPPPITVVKDIDLYRLLRAADAHLGLLSTVLTEAVVTGTPNLIALTDGHTDLLGYVEAGVAHPVRTRDEVAAALEHLQPPDPAARQAFLDRHFLAGDASARVIDVVEAVIGTTPAAVAG
jgi:hypothetical protein